MLEAQQLADGLNAFYFLLLPMRSGSFLCRQGVDMRDIRKSTNVLRGYGFLFLYFPGWCVHRSPVFYAQVAYGKWSGSWLESGVEPMVAYAKAFDVCT